MERRDYLEREIEKMRAVLQKIFGLRVDKEEELPEAVSIELKRYFDLSLQQVQQMTEEEFRVFVRNKNASLTDFLGNLLYASIDLKKVVNEEDKSTLRKILIAWESWESKTKTFDLEKSTAKEQIRVLLNATTH
jgi:hypothetical protein